MKKEVTLIINARVQSTRIQNKMLRPFACTSLLDIALTKLVNVKTKSPKFLAAADKEIIDIYESKYSKTLGLLERDPSTVLPKKDISKQNLTFEHYKKIKTPFIMSINACCPFFKEEKIEEALSVFINSNMKTMTTVRKNCNIFFNEHFKPVNQNGVVIASVGNSPLYEMAHVFHVFDKDFFIKNEYFWDYSNNNPGFFEVSKEESLDIDEPIDFQICESLYALQ